MATIPFSQLLIAGFGDAILIGTRRRPPIIALTKSDPKYFSINHLNEKYVSDWGTNDINNAGCDTVFKDWINDNWNNLDIPAGKTIVVGKGRSNG